MPDQTPPEADKPEQAQEKQEAQVAGPAESQPKKRRGRVRYTYEEWNAVYLAWRAGERNQIALSRKFHIDSDTIGTWVRKGIPSMDRRSFLDRFRDRSRDEDEDDIVKEAKSKAADRMASEILDERGTIRKGNLQILLGLRQTIGQTLVKAIRKMDTISWSRQEKITVMDGDQKVNRLVEIPLDAREFASIVRMLSGAIALTGKMESFFCGDVVDPDELPEELQFTVEEKAFIAKPGNEDQLPPGMTLEQFARKVAAFAGVQPMKKGDV
jgi:hypothetical protein